MKKLLALTVVPAFLLGSVASGFFAGSDRGDDLIRSPHYVIEGGWKGELLEDYDGDGDKDFFRIVTLQGNERLELYENVDGSYVFYGGGNLPEECSNWDFTGGHYPFVHDANNNGFLDVHISGDSSCSNWLGYGAYIELNIPTTAHQETLDLKARLEALESQFEAMQKCAADVNKDQTINTLDILEVVSSFGQDCVIPRRK